jgi:hypothetical protein
MCSNVLQHRLGFVDWRVARELKGRCTFNMLIPASSKPKSFFVIGNDAMLLLVHSKGGIVLIDYSEVGGVTACLRHVK